MAAFSLVPRLSDHAEELVGESLVSTASGSGCVTYSQRQVLTLHDACSLIYELVTS